MRQEFADPFYGGYEGRGAGYVDDLGRAGGVGCGDRRVGEGPLVDGCVFALGLVHIL